MISCIRGGVDGENSPRGHSGANCSCTQKEGCEVRDSIKAHGAEAESESKVGRKPAGKRGLPFPLSRDRKGR